jgi:hypothetical protein
MSRISLILLHHKVTKNYDWTKKSRILIKIDKKFYGFRIETEINHESTQFVLHKYITVNIFLSLHYKVSLLEKVEK